MKRLAAELAQQESESGIAAVRNAEAEASSSKATKDVLAPPKTWWSTLSPWARETPTVTDSISTSEQEQVDGKKSGERS